MTAQTHQTGTVIEADLGNQGRRKAMIASAKPVPRCGKPAYDVLLLDEAGDCTGEKVWVYPHEIRGVLSRPGPATGPDLSQASHDALIEELRRRGNLVFVVEPQEIEGGDPDLIEDEICRFIDQTLPPQDEPETNEAGIPDEVYRANPDV